MKKLIKNKKVAYLLLVIVIIITSALTTIFLVNKSASQKTYPLGDQLEYIGQTGYGCFLICENSPATTYFYKTDMNVDEVVTYFKKATIKDGGDFELTHPATEPTSFSLQTTNSNNPIGINYYVDGSQKINGLNLIVSAKKHLVTIQGEDYQAAKDAL